MGGQTGLNCGIELHDLGVFDKYGVQVLACSETHDLSPHPSETIRATPYDSL